MALSTSVLCLGIICSLLTVAQTQEITYNVQEEREPYTVGNLPEDLNFETTPDMRFQFLTTTWENQTYFELNSATGDIKTTQPIDRETICLGNGDATCQYELEVLVLPQTAYRFIRIHVIIEDINDHTPSFSNFVLPLEIPESVAVGTKIPLENAEDPDVGANSVQRYALMNYFGGTFGLVVENSVSLQLEVTAALDRETRSRYLLTLQAYDGGNPPRIGSVVLNVTVLDSNDNAPQFQMPSYAVSIEENTPVGTEILQVVAMDPDWGTNGQIEYSFSSSVTQAARQVLEINEVTGMISVKGILDYEQQPSFQLVVKATNRVSNPVPDFTTVTINIIDINDNFPALTVNALDAAGNQWVYLSEDTPTGTLVAFVKASDPDGGNSGMVRVSLSDTMSDFGLQEVSDGQYFISTLRTLDREAVDIYNISIRATDQGSPARTTIRNIVIIVDDINDNAPFFATPVYYANVDENNRLSVPVATLSAQDPDEGTNSDISYQLWTQRDAFAVDASSGVITANVILDRETQSSISLFVSACDHGVPVLCSNATVVIDVQDQNDNEPIFQQQSYRFSITENQFVNSVVGYTKATDSDSGQNARLTYTISEADANGADDFFRIEAQTGKILNKRVVDREKHNTFQFEVTATDHGVTPLTSQVLVSILVQDENDNAPQVISPNASNDTFFIPQSADPGFLVVPIEASDQDLGENSQLSYSISNGDKGGIFGINTEGQVLTAQRIAKTWEGVHKITVQISDGGTPPQTTQLDLIIVVTDLDFNTSIPASEFFEKFNLTASDFGLDEGDDKDQHTSPLTTWPIIATTVPGSTVIFLCLVFVKAYCKHHSKKKAKQASTVPKDLPSSDSRNGTDYFTDVHSMSPQRKLSTDSSPVSIATSLSSIPSKNIMKWRAQAALVNGTLDSRLGNNKMTTFGSNSDVMSDTSARRTPDSDAEVQRLLTMPRMETDAVSDNSNRSSYDSGQGGHEDQDSTQDVFPFQQHTRGTPRSASCPRLSGLASPSAQGNIPSRDNYMASPTCTPECATLGHSDLCWNQPQQRRPKSASGCIIPQQPIHKPVSVYPVPNGSVGYAPKPGTSVGNGRRVSADNYGDSSTKAFSRNSADVSSASDSYQDGMYTCTRGMSGKQRPAASNSYNAVSSTEHANNKHYRNSGTPVILSPITEDPMEVTDSRTALQNACINGDYAYHRGSSDQVYPISTLIRHENGSVYDNYGQCEVHLLGGDAVDSDVRYQRDLADVTSRYYPSRSMQTCL